MRQFVEEGNQPHPTITTRETDMNTFTTTYRYLATAIMAGAFGFFGSAKILKLDIVTASGGWDRLPESAWAAIGAVELAAVAGLLLALAPRLRALGVAAAGGLAVLTASAVVYHLVNGDPGGDIAPAVVQFVISSGYVIAARLGRPATAGTHRTASGFAAA